MPAVTQADRSVIDLRGPRSAPPPAPSRNWLLTELQRPAAFMFPLRLFISIGWLRSVAEKLGDSAWTRGRAVGDFLDVQAASGAIVFPGYEWLAEHVLGPAGGWVGWLVILLQLGVGLAILTGWYTNLALLVGVVMNINFMLAGAVNPSAFYIVIQAALFAAGAGAVIGVDGRSAGAHSILLVAHPDTRRVTEEDRWAVMGLIVLAASVSWLGFAHVRDFSPTGITDPGLVLGTVMGIATLFLLILRLRMIDTRRLARVSR